MELSVRVGKYELSVGATKRASLPIGTSIGNSYFGGGVNGQGFRWLLPGAKIDYQREAGDPWRNVIVAACLNWIGRNSPQAPPCLYQMDADGNEQVVTDHPLVAKLKRPNPYYDWRVLRQAMMISLIAGRGNAYWWVKRQKRTGLPEELWYIPHFQIFPLWTKFSTTDNWIEGYAYKNNGTMIRLTNEEVIHFRDGLDPYETRMALDPLGSSFREQVQDNEGSGYSASLLKNLGITPTIISPTDAKTSFSDEELKQLKTEWEEGAGGDNRFRPMVSTGGVRVDQLALNPSELLMEHAQDRPEARLCALIGINPVVIGLSVGLEHSTYANMEEARRAAWEDGIIPRLDLMNAAIDAQLLSFYTNDPSLSTGCDYRRVRALADSLDNLYKRNTLAVGGPWMTRNEARLRADLDTIEGGDELYPAGKAAPDDEKDGRRPGDKGNAK